MVTFIHTADLQIGRSFEFLDHDQTRESLKNDRIEVISSIAREVKRSKAEFVLMCGDLFETSVPSNSDLIRTSKKLAEIDCIVYLLAGNHEWLGTHENILENNRFLENKPSNVVVLKHGINRISAEVEIYAVPLTSNANQQEVLDSINNLPPKESTIRILAMHGAVDNLNQNPESIKYEALTKVVADGLADYIALGDRHSTTNVDDPTKFSSEMQGRIFYSGAPEPTDFREDNQRNILKVSVDEDLPRVEAIELGRWHFIELGSDNPIEFNSKDDVTAFFEAWVSKSGKTKIVRLNCKTNLETDDYIEFRSLLQTLHTEYFGEFTEHKDNPPNREPVSLDQSDDNPLNLQGYLLDAYRLLRNDSIIDENLKQEALVLFHRIARDNEN